MTHKWTGDVIAYIDMLIALVVIGFALMEEPTIKVATSDKPVCQMAIDTTWQPDLSIDVDTWVRGPDNAIVGYSAKDSYVFNLIRDDTGTGDGDYDNSERVCAKVLADGEYVVNLHMFGSNTTLMPLPVDVKVALVDPHAATMTEIFSKSVELTFPGEEITIVRFEIRDGKKVAGSEYYLPIKLRPKKGNQGGVGH